MARIGDYIQPGLNAYDPTPYLKAQGDATRTIGAGISNAIGDFGDVLKEQREKKNEVKANSKLIESYMTLFPDSAKSLEGIKNALADEDTPVSERHAIAKTTGDLIGAYLDKQRNDATLGMQQQQIDMEGRRVAVAEGQAAREATVFNANFEDGQQVRAAEKETRGLVAPALIEQYIKEAKDQEAAGASPLISSARLQDVLQTGTTEAKMGIAAAIASMQPETKEPTIREVDVTIDGQPSRLPVTFNRQTGQFDPIKIGGGNQAWGDGSGGEALPEGIMRVPFTTYSKGGDAGPDELTDKWTEKGYSSSGKNLTPGMVAVNTDVHPLGTVFRDPKSGEVFIAGDRHGNKNRNVIDFYQEPGSYKAQKGQRDLEIIGRETQVGGTPEQVQAQLGKYRGGSRVTPGAAKGTAAPQTPAQAQLEALAIQKATGEVAAQESAMDKQTDMKGAAKASAEGAIQLIDKLRTHPGFESAVGMSLTPGFMPATDRKGAEAIVEQLKGQAFLNAIQQLRGLGALSDAEGAKLQQAAARLNTNQSEKDFKVALSDYEKIIKDAVQRLGGTSAAATPAASYSDRLRSLK